MHGAEVPYPYGGKPRVIMVDLDQQALQSRGLSPSDVAQAVQRQNVILPSGDVKIGAKDYMLATNNSPDVIASINQFPVGQVDGRTIFIHDVGHVHDGYQVQTNSVAVDGKPGALITVRKTGGVSTLSVIDGIKDALWAGAAGLAALLAAFRLAQRLRRGWKCRRRRASGAVST